jgi:hypothetical protein
MGGWAHNSVSAQAGVETAGHLDVLNDSGGAWQDFDVRCQASSSDGDVTLLGYEAGTRPWPLGQARGITVRVRADGRAGNYGYLCVLSANGQAVQRSGELRFTVTVGSPGTGTGARLGVEESLTPGRKLVAPNGRAELVNQLDGNLVLYGDGVPLWASGTQASPGVATMQADGNLVLYSGSGIPLWASSTAGNPGARLVLQDDGNLVIYRQDGVPIWASGTSLLPR